MIQKLEDELGAKLFDRRSKPVVPTVVGRIVVEQARELLNGARRLREQVDEQQSTVCGEFSVAVLPTIAPYLLPRFLPEFSRKYPQIDLQISEMKTADVKRALLKGEIDAAIVAQLSELEEFNADTLFFEQYFVYASPSSELHDRDSIRTADLREVPLWLLDEGHCFRDQLVNFCHLKSARRSQRSYHLGSIETFMRMVESGLGATFHPRVEHVFNSLKSKTSGASLCRPGADSRNRAAHRARFRARIDAPPTCRRDSRCRAAFHAPTHARPEEYLKRTRRDGLEKCTFVVYRGIFTTIKG